MFAGAESPDEEDLEPLPDGDRPTALQLQPLWRIPTAAISYKLTRDRPRATDRPQTSAVRLCCLLPAAPLPCCLSLRFTPRRTGPHPATHRESQQDGSVTSLALAAQLISGAVRSPQGRSTTSR